MISLVSPNLSLPNKLPQKIIKLGIMASGSGTNFAAIAQAIADKKLNAEIKN